MIDQIKIHLVTPDASVLRTGNRCTAQQWADLLGEIGCKVSICGPDQPIDSEILIALHGERSHDSIVRFRNERRGGKIVLAMTGTDIYPEPSEKVTKSMELSDRIVVLQVKALEKIPVEFQKKCRVIVQSAAVRFENSKFDPDFFDICVVGHFRDVKDPLRAAAASQLLPETSRIRIRHAGGILDVKFGRLIEAEMAGNPRYEWLGELDETAVAELLSNSRAMVLSSFAEGGARVIGEAIVHRSIVISTEIDAAVGLLGADYPAFFKPGESHELSSLMVRLEGGPEFYQQLKTRSELLKPLFHPKFEKEAWRALISEIGGVSQD